MHTEVKPVIPFCYARFNEAQFMKLIINEFSLHKY